MCIRDRVMGGVQLAVVEPAEERRLRFIEGLGERLRPEQVLARKSRPGPFEIALRLGDELAVGVHAGNVGLLDERRCRRKNAFFLQDRFNVRRHTPPPWLEYNHKPASMTTIKKTDLIQSVADALQFISYYHPADYIRALGRAYEREPVSYTHLRAHETPEHLVCR